MHEIQRTLSPIGPVASKRTVKSLLLLLPSQVFLADTFPWWFSVAGYLSLMCLGSTVIPFLYPKIKWYQVAVAYVLAVVMALPNTCEWEGVLPMSMPKTYP